MPRSSKVRLLKQVKTDTRWILAPVLFDVRGRVRKDRVRIKDQEEFHPEGSYFLEWFFDGTRHKAAVGTDAWRAAERMRIKQAELNAKNEGLILEKEREDEPGKTERVSLASALEKYIQFIQDHRSLRTFRTYRPILNAFGKFCSRAFVDEVTREDLLDFATHCKRDGQEPKTIYNKLVVLSQFLKAEGKPKLLNPGDWPRFVEAVRPCYEDEELEQLFEACNPQEEIRFKFYLMSGFRDSEGRFVTWRDVNFKNSTVRVTAKPHWDFHPKNYEERVVPVPSSLIRALEKFRPKNARPDDPLFPSQTGKPDGAMLEKLKAVAYRVGLNCGYCKTDRGHHCAEGPYCKRWFLHKFRHTFATRHLQDGIDIRTLQLWMGHKDIASTMVYLKGLNSHEVQAKINNGRLAAFA